MKNATTTEAKITSNADSVKGNKLLEDKLRGPMKANEAVIIESDSKSVDDAAYKSYVTDLYGKIKALGPDIIQSSTSYYDSSDPTLVSPSKKAMIIPLTMAGRIDKANDNIKDVLSIVKDANGQQGFTVHVAGVSSVNHDFNTQSEKDLSRTEYGPLPIALIILLVVFGAVLVGICAGGAGLPVDLRSHRPGGSLRPGFPVLLLRHQHDRDDGPGSRHRLLSVHRLPLSRGARPRRREDRRPRTSPAQQPVRTVLFSGMTVVFALAGC